MVIVLKFCMHFPGKMTYANSVDPDQTSLSQSDKDLQCLLSVM